MCSFHQLYYMEQQYVVKSNPGGLTSSLDGLQCILCQIWDMSPFPVLQYSLVKADISGGHVVFGLERFRLTRVLLVKAEFRRVIRLNEDIGQYG